MGMLTVRENIAFSAALRLSSSVSNKDKTQRVTELIEELGLTKCADTKVRCACAAEAPVELTRVVHRFGQCVTARAVQF